MHTKICPGCNAFAIATLSSLVLGGTTVLPWNRRTYFSRYQSVEVTAVLPWYRNTTNTAVLPYGTCQQVVISAKIFVRKKQFIDRVHKLEVFNVDDILVQPVSDGATAHLNPDWYSCAAPCHHVSDSSLSLTLPT